jgi:hypothetical protein
VAVITTGLLNSRLPLAPYPISSATISPIPVLPAILLKYLTVMEATPRPHSCYPSPFPAFVWKVCKYRTSKIYSLNSGEVKGRPTPTCAISCPYSSSHKLLDLQIKIFLCALVRHERIDAKTVHALEKSYEEICHGFQTTCAAISMDNSGKTINKASYVPIKLPFATGQLGPSIDK